jgi:hypothetical protein
MANTEPEFFTIEELVSRAIPDGEYTARVKEITSGLSSQKKTPFVKLAIQLSGGDNAGYDDSISYYLSPKALRILGSDLFKCGVRGMKLYPATDEKGAEDMATYLESMVGLKVKVANRQEKDLDGISRNRFRIIGTESGEALELAAKAGSTF